MGLFKEKRTFKSVGNNIGRSIERQKAKDKIIRTLVIEESEREKERELDREIKELKGKRPSFVRSAISFAKKSSEYYNKKQKESLSRSKKIKKGKPLSIRDLI